MYTYHLTDPSGAQTHGQAKDKGFDLLSVLMVLHPQLGVQGALTLIRGGRFGSTPDKQWTFKAQRVKEDA